MKCFAVTVYVFCISNFILKLSQSLDIHWCYPGGLNTASFAYKATALTDYARAAYLFRLFKSYTTQICTL